MIAVAWFLKNWRLVALGAAVAGLVGLWLTMGHYKAQAAEQRARADKAEALAAKLTDARTKDQQAAQASYNAMQESCRTDVVAAIKGGRTVERIINAPAPIPGASRGIVGAGELRDIIGEPTRP